MRAPSEHIKTLQRRVDFLKSREHQNSFDLSELGSLEWAIINLQPQRTWVGLTSNEIDQGLLRTNYAMQTAGVWRDGVEWAIKKLKERNA